MCLYCIPIQKQLSPRTVCTRKRGFPWQPPFCTGGSRLDDSGGDSEKGSGIPLRFCWNLSRKTWHGFNGTEDSWSFLLWLDCVELLHSWFLGPRCLVIWMVFQWWTCKLFSMSCIAKFETPHFFSRSASFGFFRFCRLLSWRLSCLPQKTLIYSSKLYYINIQFNCRPSPLATSHV